MTERNSTSKAKWEIEHAAQEAVKVIAQAAGDAAKVVASAAAEAIKISNAKNAEGNNDHDLIIKLDVKLDSLKDDISKLGDGTAKTISDHEDRIRTVETNVTRILTWGAIGLLFVGLAEFLLIHYWK